MSEEFGQGQGQRKTDEIQRTELRIPQEGNSKVTSGESGGQVIGDTDQSRLSRVRRRIAAFFSPSTHEPTTKVTPLDNEPATLPPPFPAGHLLESLNAYAQLPPEGRRLMLEMLAYARDVIGRPRGSDTDPIRRERNVAVVADAVAKFIDPDYPSEILDKERYDPTKLDPTSTAAKYRDTLFKMINPLSEGQIYLGLRTLAPGKEFKRPVSVGYFSPEQPYIPQLYKIDKTKL